MYALTLTVSINISPFLRGKIVGVLVHVITLGLDVLLGGLVAHGSIFML